MPNELKSTATQQIERSELGFDRDVFLRTLIHELSGVLQDVVGLQEASGFVSIVGQRIGEEFNERYRRAFGTEVLSKGEVAAAMVDLKRRIGGQFYVIEESEDRIVLGNRACPFAEKVMGRPSMCMMTSNVFGSIAASNLGYAKVDLEQTIASGNPECRVVIHLRPGADPQDIPGREYFKTGA